MTLDVNGTATQLTLPPTASWDDWATVTEPVTLQAGQNTVAVDCAAGDDCNVNVDDISVTAPGATAAPLLPSGPLGGYLRSFDSADGTYTASPSCTGSESNTTCQAPIPSMAPGLLDRSGWYLLDDTQTAAWTPSGWIQPRPAGDLQDGYLFGYGENYAEALHDLAALTGQAPLLPEYAFGNWFSRYYPYTTSQYENQLLPEFQANGVSLDTLSVDTDWKSPNQWDGWEWNPALFPDPTAFLSWARSHGIHVTMNIHSSVSTGDPQYAQAQAIAGGTLAPSSCQSGPCAVWDWSKIPQAESNFALQQPIQDQGVAFWWLDWCCDASNVSMPGVTPDSWINHLYAQDLINSGQRGFVLARIGASLQNSTAGSYAAGPWADHRSAIHFTGDTWSTWNTLATQAQLAADEGSIGEPYVSNDTGGFLGPPSGAANDPDDLYLRWLQLGTFQPIMREHSNSGQNPRLPWDYDSATQAAGDKFLQLRESLVPYMYTLAQQASSSGLPMTRALYLDYPAQPSAYDHPGEYLLGSDMLAAPVTTPGSVTTTTVWFPPGRWTDWFTGATFTGPSTQTLQVPLDRMPVFVKAGGIVPIQPSSGHASTAGSAALTLRVFSGASGRYTMYDDAGQGLGYTRGQYTDTPVTYTSGSASSTVVIGPAHGSYPGAPASLAVHGGPGGPEQPPRCHGGRAGAADLRMELRQRHPHRAGATGGRPGEPRHDRHAGRRLRGAVSRARRHAAHGQSAGERSDYLRREHDGERHAGQQRTGIGQQRPPRPERAVRLDGDADHGHHGSQPGSWRLADRELVGDRSSHASRAAPGSHAVGDRLLHRRCDRNTSDADRAAAGHAGDHLGVTGHRIGGPGGDGKRRELRGLARQQLHHLQRRRHELGRAAGPGHIHRRQLGRQPAHVHHPVALGLRRPVARRPWIDRNRHRHHR